MISIAKVEITNFRNIKHKVLNLNSSTSIITGKNKLGKSNVLNAINWILTDTLLTDKYGVGENDIDSIVPVNRDGQIALVKGEYTEVKITLDTGTEYSKIYKLGYSSDGSKINKHTTEYKRNGVPVGTMKEFYSELYSVFNFKPAFNSLKINEIRLMTNPLYALLIIDPKELRKLLVAMGCTVSNEELYQMGFEYMRPLESKFQGRWEDVRKDAQDKLKRSKELFDVHNNQLILFNNIPTEYEGNYDELKELRDNLASKRTEILIRSNSDAVKDLDMVINETRVDEKQKINERNNYLDSQIKDLISQINNAESVSEQNYQAATKDLKDEASGIKDQIIELNGKRGILNEEIRSLESNIRAKYKEIDTHNDNITNYADELGILINPEGSGKEIKCPYCNQIFVNFTDNIEGRKTELRRLLKSEQDNINTLTDEINKSEDLLQTKNGHLTELDNKIQLLHESLEKVNVNIAEVKREPINTSDLRNQVFELQQAKLKPLDKSKLPELEAQRNDLVNNAEATKKAQMDEINNQIKQLDEQITKELMIKNDVERKNTLKDAMTQDQIEINKNESWLGQVNKFIHTMIMLINKRAKEITGFDFVMLEENLTNGNLTECCYALIEGVPFKDLNTADKMKYGIRFIEKCRQINQAQTGSSCEMPILADRLESIAFIKDIRCSTMYQYICTRVSEDEEIGVI